MINVRRWHPRQHYITRAVLAVVVAIGIMLGINRLLIAQRQAMIGQRGAQVMPFDLDSTTHFFSPAADGGIQQVIVDNPSDGEQIQLIRAHLQAEAAKFSQGMFSDPAAIHGAEMPGLAALQAGAERIHIQYSDLSQGGQITYTTQDPALIQALHQWFDAQLADHGNHAAPGGHQQH